MDILDRIVGEESVSQSIGIQPIHIRFSTNVNSNPSTILTKSLLYTPKKKDKDNSQDQEDNSQDQEDKENSQYPYFTDTVKFPTSKILKLSRKDQLKLFFDKLTFKKVIGNVTNVNEDVRIANAEYNFNALLNILLPTSFPIKNNIYETFSGNIKDMNGGSIENTSDDFDIFNMFSKLLSEDKNKYSYISLNGKVYTVIKITRINDIINDQIFLKFIQGGKNFQSWRKGKILEIAKNVKFLQNRYKDLINTYLEKIQNGINQKEGPIFDAIGRISSKSFAGNNRSIVPVKLLVQEFDNLANKKKEQFEDISSIFVRINNLKEASKERSQTYIPIEIESLPGFRELLKISMEYNTKKELLNTLQDLNEITKYLDIRKDNDVNDLNIIEKRVYREINNYDRIKGFLNELKQYTSPVRTYSNPNLTYILGEIKNNMDEFIKFVDFINAISIEGEKPKDDILNNGQMIERLRTGVMCVSNKSDKNDSLDINSDKFYDALINLELVDGEVDDENINDIKCPYRDRMLSKMYKNMKNSEQKNPVLFYIDDQPFDMARAKKTEKKKETIKTPKKRGGKRRGGFGAGKVRTLSNSLSTPRTRKRRKYTTNQDTTKSI